MNIFRSEDRGSRIEGQSPPLFHACALQGIREGARGEGVDSLLDPRSSLLAPRSSLLDPRSSSGFTLVEMIMVIVITGIIGGMVAVFLKAPIQQYLDVSRRAELTDIADMALYRLTADISTAVPNSLRVAVCGTNLNSCVEFLPARDVGRYRANAVGGAGTCGVAGDALDFTSADSCFEIIGQPVNFQAGDSIVVGSTQSDGVPAYDTTASGVLRAASGVVGTSQSRVTFVATQFPAFAQLSSQRFDVVDGTQQAVTYACEGTLGALDSNGNGQARLMRHSLYGFNAVQVAPASLGGSSARLADKISACAIDYITANQRLGLLGVRLTLTSNNERVSLYKEIHVNNAP